MFILQLIFYCIGIKVSNISSVINESSSLPTDSVNTASSNNSIGAISGPDASITMPLNSGTPVSTASNVSNSGSASTTQSMQLNDAFAYLDRVRAEFSDQPEIYNKFLQVMREFKSNR